VCGRFNLTASGEELAEAFGLDEPPAVAPRYNIAPSQPVLVVRQLARRRKAQPLRWGLEATPLIINARSESAATRTEFRESFRQRRCLVPASGFYEWKRTRGLSSPFHVRRRDRRVFALAGLWTPGPPADAEAGACVILTTEPNALVAPIHDRMPVIVPPEAYGLWLEAAPERLRELGALLHAAPDGDLEAVPVADHVNATTNDGPECLAPAPARPRQGLLFPELDADP
jgi:putative SOS response-associated peptidase YedK